MGLIARLLGLGPAISGVAEVFTENRTQRGAQEHAEQLASLSQLGAEFQRARGGWIDRLVDGLNRLPRPFLALGTVGLFGFAMADPVAFGIRMQGLALVPDPLWWLLGAIVSFYFGARELHHFRAGSGGVTIAAVAEARDRVAALQRLDGPGAAPSILEARDPGQVMPEAGPEAPRAAEANAALAEWRALR